MSAQGAKVSGSTENRRRFEAARGALSWTLARTAREIEVSPKLIEGWLYERRRDVPRLAVLLIEEMARRREEIEPVRVDRRPGCKGASQPAVAQRNAEIVRRLRAGEAVWQMSEEMHLSQSRIYQIAKAAGLDIRFRRIGEEQKRAARIETAIALVREGMSVIMAAETSGAPRRVVETATRPIIAARISWRSDERRERMKIALAAVRKHGTYRAGVRASGASYRLVKAACLKAGVEIRASKHPLMPKGGEP